MKSADFVWHSEADCKETAIYLAEQVTGGMSVGLIGELGAGKTTFMRYLLAELGSTDLVSSPTFILQHEYKTSRGIIEHWDIYRLNGMVPEELLEPPPSDTIRFIEWANLSDEVSSMLDCSLLLTCAYEGDSIVRKVQISFITG